MKRKFYKMHALGNDYLYFDCFTAPLENPAALAARLSDRRKSVGGAGIVLLEKSGVAHAKMRIFNADGSEAETCGNGLRCVAKFLRDVRGVKDTPLKIETLAGVKTLTPALNGRGETESICAEMGRAEFAAEKIPVTAARRDLFAYVPQGNFLFSGTIYENLTFFCEKPVTKEAIGAALESACAKFVYDLPEGLSTSLKERGGGLSEGQLQRLAVARALLSDRPILLLDEATSALDSDTEKALLCNIRAMKNKTCLIVTHRPAALEIADEVIRVEKGVISADKTAFKEQKSED